MRRIARALAAFVGMIALVLAFTATPSAYAGTNGQQIVFVSRQAGVTATWVGINGLNQNNTFVRDSRNFGFPGYRNYWYSDYWWKGHVSVFMGLSVQNPGLSTSISCRVYVPPQQDGDWVYVYYNRYGCWR